MFNKLLYNTPYHNGDLSRFRFLVTGGAGFIGSNFVEYLLRYNAGHVRVLDNLSNGYYNNIIDFLPLKNFEFIEGDIRDFETCKKAVQGVDFISHQAALGSVPRSIADPIITNEVNIAGFLNMLVAAKECRGVKKLVYAASSSTYGDSLDLPKIEGNEGDPLSPYAVTKLVNELYADVFSKVYGFNTIGLRYFNVFGPKQNANNPYAAVIPIFCKHFIHGTQPIINGDGKTSRDFTFVENVVQANIRALLVNEEVAESNLQLQTLKTRTNSVFNVACGDQISLNELVVLLQEISGKIIEPMNSQERAGDVRHSKASIEKFEKYCGYSPRFKFRKGLEIAYSWYQENEFNKL
jgi:UDP-N-acetylglucosamine 4-epimerase